MKKKYLKFIKSQEVAGELFKDKLGQLNNYYIPISEMIYKNYSKNKKTSIIITCKEVMRDKWLNTKNK